MSLRSLIARAAIAAAVTLGGSACASANVVKPSPEAAREAGDKFDFDAWNALLARYVDDKGRVDYQRLKAAPADMRAFEKVYAQVAAQKMDALGSRNAKLAFLIDAYNVCVWKNVLARLPKLKSVDDEKLGFFYLTKFIVAGKEINLYNLEGDEIRPVFKDPRVHMALNCASGGCPQLPPEAFTPARLDAQLEREATKFVNEERNVSYDPQTNTVKLSRIFDWYAKDFDKQPLRFIDKRRAPDRQIPENAKIKYIDYDWRLNDRSLPR
jgi:hypothetical protein